MTCKLTLCQQCDWGGQGGDYSEVRSEKIEQLEQEFRGGGKQAITCSNSIEDYFEIILFVSE